MAQTHPAGKRASTDRAGVDAGLVQAHRAGACAGAVVVADERHRRRKVERLAQPFRSANQYKLRHAVAGGREACDDAPDRQSAEDQSLARQPVRGLSGEGRRQRVDPGERRADETELLLGEAVPLAQQGKHRE